MHDVRHFGYITKFTNKKRIGPTKTHQLHLDDRICMRMEFGWQGAYGWINERSSIRLASPADGVRACFLELLFFVFVCFVCCPDASVASLPRAMAGCSNNSRYASTSSGPYDSLTWSAAPRIVCNSPHLPWFCFFSFNQSVSQSINAVVPSCARARAYIAIAVLPESVADPCNVLIAPVIKHWSAIHLFPSLLTLPGFLFPIDLSLKQSCCVCVCYFPIAWERDQCLRMWSMYMSLWSTIGWWSMCLLASLLCGVIGGMISHSFEPCSCMSVYAWFIPFSFFLCKLLVAQSFSFLLIFFKILKKWFQEGFFLLLRSMERSLMWKLHVDGGWDREQVYQT